MPEIPNEIFKSTMMNIQAILYQFGPESNESESALDFSKEQLGNSAGSWCDLTLLS